LIDLHSTLEKHLQAAIIVPRARPPMATRTGRNIIK